MAKEYKVLKITELIKPGDTGGVTKFYRVQYKSTGGVTDAADFDEKDYTEEKVAATLTKLAQKHDKILAL